MATFVITFGRSSSFVLAERFFPFNCCVNTESLMDEGAF